MKLVSFRIKHYRSIIDTGDVELSDNDNVSVFAGQNESGKSSILKALRDFEEQGFDPDSVPFYIRAKPIPIVSCTYKVDASDNIAQHLSNKIVSSMSTEVKAKLQIKDAQKILDGSSFKSLSKFTLIGSNENGKFKLAIDKNSLKVFLSLIPSVPGWEIGGGDNNRKNSIIASWFWEITPSIVFFDDFCDILPDQIYVSELEANNSTISGYRAVRNLEEILDTKFAEKDKEPDSIRGATEDSENEEISVDFQADWGQQIHKDNKIIVKYEFEKRNEGKSYVNFYVETKKGQRLRPRQRSRGLIWFLSLWLELKAQDLQYKNLVLLLDEPDQHLHVKAQEDILKLINRLSRQNNQILYATHSPHLIQVDFLSRIKLVFNTEKEGTKIEKLTTNNINAKYKKDALQPIALAIGFGASEFSPLEKKNVILEGVSDFYYFSAMKKIFNKVDEYVFVPGVGLKRINGLISLLIGYGLSWVAIIDDDPKKGGNDSKKTFDEIKDFVFDGDENKTKEKVHVLDQIAGIENMFTLSDLKLVDPKIRTKAIGQGRKILFSKLFFEKVNNGEISEDKLSDQAKDNFKKAFEFIERNLLNIP